MKKFYVALVVICMVSLVTVTTFAAYATFDGTGVVTSVDSNEGENEITVNVTEDFLTKHAGGGFNIIVFNADPGLKEENGDTDFKILYQASLGSDTTGGTLIAANKCDKDNRTVVSDKFEQGTTYYICLMAHNGANWAWTATTYSFTYGATEQPTDEPTQAPTEEPTQAPTDEITQAPTGEITPAPTEEPTQSPSEGATEVPSDPGTDTLALSVVAYALVAITGCGALLVIKKK